MTQTDTVQLQAHHCDGPGRDEEHRAADSPEGHALVHRQDARPVRSPGSERCAGGREHAKKDRRKLIYYRVITELNF